MNYKKWLETELKKVMPNIIVAENLFELDNENEYMVINYSQGTIYKNTTVIPVVLNCYTFKPNETQAILSVFCKAFSETDFIDDDGNYIKQRYSTPFNTSNFNDGLNKYYSNILIQAYLTISENISDIKEVKIDGEAIEATERDLNYVTIIDSQKIGSNTISTSKVKQAGITLSLIMPNKNSIFCNKLRLLRSNLTANVNTQFNVEVTFNDGYTESYVMYCDSQSLKSINGTLPINSIVLRV